LNNRIKEGTRGVLPSWAGLFYIIAAGTVLAFVISLLPLAQFVETYRKIHLPRLGGAEALVVALALVMAGILIGLPSRIWRSLRLGLIPIGWVWAPFVAGFWLAYEIGRALMAWESIVAATLLTAATQVLARTSNKSVRPTSGFLETDLPVAEGGRDLLGREAIVETLVSAILLEQPTITAITGKYGDGKTSLLNLTIGELKKSQEIKAPIIVRFSPWLAGDSDSLVLALLNSIVAEIKRNLVVPGLSGDAARYARNLLSVAPWTDKLKDLLKEPSQERRIDALVSRINRVRRRLLVVFDDLDRMEAKELETVLKFLRGSDKFSNITFLCAFCETEVALILKATRPGQDTATFIEKFFPLKS
jgi:hypothetical protein